MNGATVETKLRSERGAIHGLLEQDRSNSQKVDELVLRILLRHATPAEVKLAEGHFRQAADLREGFVDLAWALLNSQEFLFNH